MTFQIIESNRSLPSQGPNVQFSGSTDTGEGMKARAMGGLGSSVANLGIGLFVAQGQAELTEKMAEAKEQISKMHLDLEKETDPERYQQIFEETWADVEATEVKNGWASREWKLQMPDLKARQQEVVGLAQRQRVRENHTIALANAEADWIRTGNGAAYENLLSKQVEQGWLSEDDAKLKLTDTEHKAQRRQVELVALGPNPEVFLNKYKTAQDLMKDYPDLEPGDFNDLSNLALGQQRALKAEQTKLTAGILNDTLKKAQTMNLTDFREQLRQMKWITEVDKTKLLKSFIGAQKLWQDTGQDPWRETRDWPSYLQTKIDIAQGKITTPLQIYAKMLSDSKNGPLWSYVQMNDLVTDLPGNKSDILKTPFYEEWDKQIDTLYIDANKDVPKDKIPEWARAKDQLKQIAAEVGNDYTKAQAKLEQLLAPAKQAKGKSFLANLWEKSKETGAGIKAFQREHAILPGLLYGTDKEIIPQITNDTDYDALPSGTVFIDPDGKKRRKP